MGEMSAILARRFVTASKMMFDCRKIVKAVSRDPVCVETSTKHFVEPKTRSKAFNTVLQQEEKYCPTCCKEGGSAYCKCPVSFCFCYGEVTLEPSGICRFGVLLQSVFS